MNPKLFKCIKITSVIAGLAIWICFGFSYKEYLEEQMVGNRVDGFDPLDPYMIIQALIAVILVIWPFLLIKKKSPDDKN